MLSSFARQMLKVLTALILMMAVMALFAPSAAGVAPSGVSAAAVVASAYTDVTDQMTGDDSQRPAVIPSVPGTTHIVVPGTDDADGADQFGRMAGWFANGEHVMLVNYPATIGPIIGGICAPGYDDSRDQGVLNTLVAVRDIDGHVTIYGYSQGAEVAGNATELINLLGLKDDGDVSVVLLADPMFPNTGTKEQLKNQHPVVSFILKSFFNVETNGERDPADTGAIKVTSVAIMGDPVTALETWYLNPAGFVFNTVTGFFMVHSGVGSESATNMGELPVLISWTEGNTEYIVLDAKHPVVQTLEYIGIPVSARTGRFIDFFLPRTVPGQEAARAPGILKSLAFIKNEIAIARQIHEPPSSTTVANQALVVEAPEVAIPLLTTSSDELPVVTPEVQSSSTHSDASTVATPAPVVVEIPSSTSNDSNEDSPAELKVPADNPVGKEEEPSKDVEDEEALVETQEPKSDSVQPAPVVEPLLAIAA